MKLSDLVSQSLTFLLEKGDREVITAQKDTETADYTYGVVSDIVDYGDGTVGLVGSVENKVVTALDHEAIKMHEELITRLRVLIQFMETNGTTRGELNYVKSLLELVQRAKSTAISKDIHAIIIFMEKKYLPGGEYRPLNLDEWNTGLANPGAPIVTDEIKKRLNKTFGVVNHDE